MKTEKKLIESLPIWFNFPRFTHWQATAEGRRRKPIEDKIDDLDRKAENYLRSYVTKREKLVMQDLLKIKAKRKETKKK